MKVMKFIKRILGLEANYLLEDEKGKNIIAISEEEHKKQNYPDDYRVLENNLKLLKKATRDAGITVSGFREL